MKHLLSLLTACLLSLSAQAQQTWNFVDLSESIPLIKADETNWKADKWKTDAPDVTGRLRSTKLMSLYSGATKTPLRNGAP